LALVGGTLAGGVMCRYYESMRCSGASGGDYKRSADDPDANKRIANLYDPFQELVATHGAEGLRMFAIANNNDYNVGMLPQVGAAVALRAATTALRDHPTAKGLRSLARELVSEPKVKIEECDALRALERADLMYNHQAVFCPIKKGVRLAAPIKWDEYETVTQKVAEDKLGLSRLRDRKVAAGVLKGELNPQTLQPWENSPAVAAPGGEDEDEGVEVDPGIEFPPPQPTEMPKEMKGWIVPRLKQWLKDRAVSGYSTGNKSDLLAVISSMYEMGNVMPARTAADHAAVNRRRHERDANEWETIKRAREARNRVDLERESPAVPILQPQLIDDYFNLKGANTSRQRAERCKRPVVELFMVRGAEESTSDGLVKFRRYFFTAQVSKSYPGTTASSTSREVRSRGDASGHTGRVVALTVIVVDSTPKTGGVVQAIESAACVLPEALLTRGADGSPEVKHDSKYRPCRASDDGSCVHIGALADAVMQCRPAATTGAAEWGKRHSGGVLDPDSFVHDLPIRGADASEREVIPRDLLPEIDKGPRSEVYREPLNEYIAERKAGFDRRSDRLGRGRPSALTAKGRPLKVERFLDLPDGCNCEWHPESATWTVRCDRCRELVAVYIYDRGITREFLFAKYNVRVLVPDFKHKNQVVFSSESTQRSRAVATERIGIEQSNREWRLNDGFHSAATIATLGMMSAEAQVARGFGNLLREINDWADASEQGELFNPGGGEGGLAGGAFDDFDLDGSDDSDDSEAGQRGASDDTLANMEIPTGGSPQGT